MDQKIKSDHELPKGTLRRCARGRDRNAIHGEILEQPRERNVSLCGLRYGTFFIGHEIRFRHRLAKLH